MSSSLLLLLLPLASKADEEVWTELSTTVDTNGGMRGNSSDLAGVDDVGVSDGAFLVVAVVVGTVKPDTNRLPSLLLLLLLLLQP